MKSSSQIKAYLLDSRPKREIDELAIRQYCQNFGIDLSDCNNFPKTSNKPAITYRQFKSWLGNENLEKGEVITLDVDGSIGLVRSCDATSITFHALLHVSTGVLHLSSTLDRSSYHSSSAKERKQLQRALSAHRLNYLKRWNILVDKALPEDGSFVQVSILGEKKGTGIFKKVDPQGKLIFHAFVNPKNSQCHLDKTFRHFDDCQLLNASLKDKDAINNILKSQGYVWDGYSKKIGINGLRRYKGEPYFYINSYLEIIQATDNYSKQDLKRFRAKNYFVQYEDAADMLSMFSMKLPTVNRKFGNVYFYIDNYLQIIEVSDYRKPKDKRRFEVGNYFLDKNCALSCQVRFLELRDIKLRNLPTSLLKLKPKKGRKPKIQN